MSLRPPLQPDGRYALTAALLALLVAALVVAGSVVIMSALDDTAPPPTTYIVGPDGDDVDVIPRRIR